MGRLSSTLTKSQPLASPVASPLAGVGGVINNNCLTFNGVDDYVTIPNQSLTLQRTMCCWMNQEARPADTANAIFHQLEGGTGGFILGVQLFGAVIGLFTDGVNGANNINLVDAEIPSLNTNHHIGFSISAALDWVFYLDGVSTKTGTLAAGITLGSQTMYIGKRNGFNAIDAQLWDARRYATVLTADNMLYIATEGASGTAPGSPIGHWPMNEGTGTTVADIAGDNDGTIVTSDLAAMWAAQHT